MTILSSRVDANDAFDESGGVGGEEGGCVARVSLADLLPTVITLTARTEIITSRKRVVLVT